MNQNIPLFINDQKSNGTEIGNVDAMLLKRYSKGDKVRIIIGIEESKK